MELLYEPIRRVSLACTNCRYVSPQNLLHVRHTSFTAAIHTSLHSRKKARCTGERPICRRCRRSGLECRFTKDAPVESQTSARRRASIVSEQGAEAQGRGSSDRQREDNDSFDNLDWIKVRFENLEQQLGEIQTKLDA